MGYILKNTTALINSKLTDTGRQRLSQGNFNISYFQIGDSEVSYNTLPSSYNQGDTMVLEAEFNAQNSSGVPQSNKQNVKYPYYVDGFTGNTYGIPYMDSVVSPVFNRATPRGFFTGGTVNGKTLWSAYTDNEHVINSNYIVDINSLDGTNQITLIYSGCNSNIVRMPKKGDIITILYDGVGKYDCTCVTTTTTTIPTATTTTTTIQPITTTTTTDPCVIPTTTTTTFPQPTPQPSSENCYVSTFGCYPILTYKIVDVCLNVVTLDRPTPDYGVYTSNCYARTLIYPPNMTEIYDSVTPINHFNTNVINFESICYYDEFDVKIWNMNIPWSENPAGLNESIYKNYTYFGSTEYLGTKEYLGYASNSGQTDTDSVYFYNSFDEKIVVTPEEQKAIAIIHYTNNTIDYFYGEKFALEPLDPDLAEDTIGQARNFKISIPTIMWHKNPDCCHGQTFWVDPPGFDEFNLFQVEYIQSKKNIDMNSPGIRYYHLWDDNPNSNGLPSRVGKVFPDHKIVIIDDEEIIAAMSYKSNRNWTLPAPKLSLVTPNTCGDITQSSEGILSGTNECMFVTYRLTNTNTFTNSLHCNYYLNQQGPNLDCLDIGSQNIGVRFGGEFNCLNYVPYNPTTTTTTFPYTTTTTTSVETTTTTSPYITSTTTICPPTCDLVEGFYADKFEIICQKVTCGERPVSDEWKIIDFTSVLSSTTINGHITQEGLTGNTFVITKDLYDNAPYYDLSDYINLTTLGNTNEQLNFGDEYYFYGNVESDIQATIYEMRYKINLSQTEFQASSNPTWTNGNPSYITEIGLYDSNKDLMIVSKLQSPLLRQGIQQFLIKYDF